jgi:hypothetical protein|tara:strand:- start:22 stop:195 length:174 start_codon:yes stop_codon:yes gene_type:complete
MIITNAKYVKDPKYGNIISIKATIDNDELIIPIAIGNRHYDAIQEWVSKGNSIEAAD